MVIRFVVNSRSEKANQAPAKTAQRIVAGRLLKKRRVPVVPYAAYRVSAGIVDRDDSTHIRAALLGLRLLDDKGKITDAALEHWTFSKRYKQWVTYLPSTSTAGQTSESRLLSIPADVSQIDISLFQWQGSSAVRVRGAIVLHKLNETAESIQAHARRSPHIASIVCGNVLDEGTVDPGLLRQIFEFARRHGYGSLIRRSAAALLSLDLKHTERPSILLALDELRELDPNWLPISRTTVPVTATRQKRAQRGQPLHVAHLCGNASDEHYSNVQRIAGIVRQHPSDCVQPVLITPAEYLHEDAPSGPWQQANCSSLPWFRLNTLSTSAMETIERSRLMELDVILAIHICRGNHISIIHAHVGRRGYDLGLRAHAIANYLQIPVIYETREPFGLYSDEPDWSIDSELVALRQAQHLRCMHMAAAVIASDEQMKAQLVDRGIDGKKVFVVPDALDVSALEVESKAAVPGGIKHLGIIARSVPPTVLAGLLEAWPSSKKMHLAIYGNNEELELWRTISAQYPKLDVTYVEDEGNAKALEFLMSLQCLVLPGVLEHWTKQHVSCWGLKAMALGVPLVEMDNSGVFCSFTWRSKKIVLTADWRTLPELLRRIVTGIVRVKSMANGARDWVKDTRSAAKAASHYEAVYDYALKQTRSHTISKKIRAAQG